LKKYFISIILLFLNLSVFALNWGDIYWTVRPSSVPNLFVEGSSFDTYFTDRKWPDIKYEVYNDIHFANTDGKWVYNQWMQDHGWHWNGSSWSGNGYAINPVRGALYIDPYEKVAIYFYPTSNTIEIFRVRVLKK